MRKRLLASLAGASVAAAVLVASAGSAAAAMHEAAVVARKGTTATESAFVKTISANWSGYAVTRTTRSHKFERVSGSWVQPAGTCRRGAATYSAIWVGLGGFNHGSRALEQTGSEVDCDSDGTAIYSAWFELVPAGPVQMRIGVHPGDRLFASVAVRGGYVIMQVKDLTRNEAQTVVRRMSDPAPDLTSAEWIVEAPSECFSPRDCKTLRLADFGTVSFTNALTTTAQGVRTGIAAAGYKVTELELHDFATAVPNGGSTKLSGAQASELLEGESAFTVAWRRLDGGGRLEREQTAESEGAPPPTDSEPPRGEPFRAASMSA